MKKILYPIILFVIISQQIIAQYIDICKQKIVLTFYKTEYCSSDLERRFSSHTDAERHEKADSLSYVAKDTLVLYKNKDAIDTLYLNSPKGPSRGMYIYTNGSIVSLNNSYSNSINKVIKVDKNTYRIIRTISDDYNPNADHSSHMSHYSSRQ